MKWVCTQCKFETLKDPRNGKQKAHCPICPGKIAWFQMFRECSCGKWFHPERYSQFMCSKKCGYDDLKKRRSSGELINPKKGKKYPHLQRARVGKCKICNKEYRAIHDHKKRHQVYCSKECFAIGWAKYSRPNIIPTNLATGDRNKSWKGDFASYDAMHKWVKRQKGKPKKCEVCGSIKKKKYEWANIDHSYKRNVDDYIRMCTSCHRRYDIENNGYRFMGR